MDKEKDNLNNRIEEQELMGKMARYCAYQERCLRDVTGKLNKYGLDQELMARIIDRLIREGYLNEDRFAKTFVRSKFMGNRWGKLKIRRALKEKEIDENLIDSAMNDISGEDYRDLIRTLIRQKIQSIREPDRYIRRNKVARYLIMKGFEPGIVWEKIKTEDSCSENIK